MIQVNDVDVIKAFDIRVIASEASEKESLRFEWTITEMTKRSVKVQILFQKARFVSMSSEPEILRVTVRDKTLFVSQLNLPVQQPKKKVKDLKRR